MKVLEQSEVKSLLQKSSNKKAIHFIDEINSLKSGQAILIEKEDWDKTGLKGGATIYYNGKLNKDSKVVKINKVDSGWILQKL